MPQVWHTYDTCHTRDTCPSTAKAQVTRGVPYCRPASCLGDTCPSTAKTQVTRGVPYCRPGAACWTENPGPAILLAAPHHATLEAGGHVVRLCISQSARHAWEKRGGKRGTNVGKTWGTRGPRGRQVRDRGSARQVRDRCETGARQVRDRCETSVRQVGDTHETRGIWVRQKPCIADETHKLRGQSQSQGERRE